VRSLFCHTANTSALNHNVIPRCTSALLYSRQLRRRYLALVFLCFTPQEYRQSVSVTIYATKPVKDLVAAHHGQVWVESPLGKGSTFFFTVPVATEERKVLSANRRESLDS
jgi:light-regulated signal transduction histidine kinase (bacteriophytochrome)